MALEFEQQELIHLTSSHPDLAHIQVKKHGKSLILFQDDEYGPENLVRFTQRTRVRWSLSFALHTGRWETTPFEGTLAELFAMVLEQFSFHLTKR